MKHALDDRRRHDKDRQSQHCAEQVDRRQELSPQEHRESDANVVFEHRAFLSNESI
jgi:hypothetical protein